MKKVLAFLIESEGNTRVSVYQPEESEVKLENKAEAAEICQQIPVIRLSRKKGMRINLIRIIYALCKLEFFVDSNGEKLPDYKVFQAFGILLGMDFSRYSNDLNRSVEDNTDMDTQTDIFRRMNEIFRRRFDIF